MASGGRGGPAAVLLEEYERRMPRDYYGFLGISFASPEDAVERASRRLEMRWRAIQAVPNLPAGAGEKAQAGDRDDDHQQPGDDKENEVVYEDSPRFAERVLNDIFTSR